MIKKLLLTTFMLIGIIEIGLSFDRNEIIVQDTIYSFTDVDKPPVPKKGMEKLYIKWNSVANYPMEARQNGVEGKVYISFIVNTKGKISETGVLKGIGSGCDEATLEAFKITKLKWRPGIKDEQKVKVKMILPFTFKLN